MQLRQKLRIGRSWHDVRVLGTHPLVQQFIALHPSLVREELRHRPVLAFPSRSLESAALRSLAARLCEATGFMPQAVPAGATVLTVSHSSYATRNPEYPDADAGLRRKAGRSGAGSCSSSTTRANRRPTTWACARRAGRRRYRAHCRSSACT